MKSEDNYLETVFLEPPLVSYRRQKNIRETIVRVKVAPERQQRGMQRWTLPCLKLHKGRQISDWQEL